jgi:radical SAM superfamily enzyme YgiQ (UPF0313 family)
LKVLLVQSHLGRIKFATPLFPIGLSYIATVLKDKHKVKILDLNMWELPVANEKLEKEMADFSPDVVGISIRNIDTTYRSDIFYHFKTIKPTTELIKQVKPDVKLLVGGAGFSIFAQKIMERIPEFDFGIYLEGEKSVPELLDNIDSPENVKGIYYRRNGAVQFTGFTELPDFSKVPMPRRDADLIDIKQYIGQMDNNIGIQSKRGCMLNCIYCGYPFLSGRNYRIRSPESVVDEIEYLVRLGIRKFTFVDNIFNVPVSHASEICEEIIKRRLDIEWSAWFDIKNTNEELLRLAKKAGCRHFGFSPDGATNKALSVLKKGITEEDLEENLKIVKKIGGIRAGYNFFFVLPETGIRNLIKTLIYYFKIPILLFGRGGVFLSWIRIEPYTEIHRIAVEKGFLAEETDLLPEDEKELEKLFYTKSAYRYIDLMVINMVKFIEKVVKPSAKFVISRTLQKK